MQQGLTLVWGKSSAEDGHGTHGEWVTCCMGSIRLKSRGERLCLGVCMVLVSARGKVACMLGVHVGYARNKIGTDLTWACGRREEASWVGS